MMVRSRALARVCRYREAPRISALSPLGIGGLRSAFHDLLKPNLVVPPSSCRPPYGKQKRRKFAAEVEVHPGIAVAQRAPEAAIDRCELGTDDRRQVAPHA